MTHDDSLEKTLWMISMMTHWKRLWCWEGLGAGGEGDDWGWDGWMGSLTRWTWVWVNSGSWWWTGRPGVLWFMGSLRVGHDWATELTELKRFLAVPEHCLHSSLILTSIYETKGWYPVFFLSKYPWNWIHNHWGRKYLSTYYLKCSHGMWLHFGKQGVVTIFFWIWLYVGGN